MKLTGRNKWGLRTDGVVTRSSKSSVRKLTGLYSL